MSVIRCSLLAANSKVTEDSNYRKTYTHDFHVVTNNKNDGPKVILEQAEGVGPHPLPEMWDTYDVLTGTGSADSGVFLQSRDVKRKLDEEDDRLHWIVTCTWSPPQPGQGGDPPEANPLNDPIRYSLEWDTFTKLVDVDVNGEPIVNGAGDEFDPPVQRDDFRPVLVAVRNMWPLQTIVNLALTYKNVVNSDTFYGAPAGTAKVESISSGPVQERNGVSFYAVTIRVQFVGGGSGTGTGDPNTDWLVRLVNRGRHYLGMDGDKKVPFQTELKAGASPGSTNPDDYQEVSPKVPLEFVNLTGTGLRKFPDYAPAELTGTAYQIYPAVAFSGLGV